MSYQALYRKYRSQRFDEMVGQEIVATTLKNAIMNGQISHAYLFSGPRGTGKTSAAKIFAKAINCPNQKDGEPCNNCEICHAITSGSLDDVIELDAASNNGVDEIREIRDKSTYAPTRATYKVYIIDEVHMLSTGAFNALLKTLEEPTDNVVFILATTELQKVPATIISRVQRFAFKAITRSDIKQHLAEVLGNEQLAYDEKALDVIAKAAEGGMRDALSLLDQALSFSDGKLIENDALLVTGSIANAALVRYVAALSAGNARDALLELDKIFAEGKDMLRFAEDLMAYFRDQLLDTASEIAHELLYQWIDSVIDALKVLRETTQTKIAADVMTMKLAEPLEAKTAQAVPQTSTDKTSDRPEMPERSSRASEILSEQRPPEQSRHQTALPPEQDTSINTAHAAQNTAKTVSSNAVSNVTSAEVQIDIPQAVTFDQSQLLSVLNEATHEDKTAVLEAWSELTSSLATPRQKALLGTVQPQAVGKTAMIVTVPVDNLVKILMADTELQDQLANFLSALTGFAPKIYAITEERWRDVRAEFVAQRKGEKTAPVSIDATPNATLDATPVGFPLPQEIEREDVSADVRASNMTAATPLTAESPADMLSAAYLAQSALQTNDPLSGNEGLFDEPSLDSSTVPIIPATTDTPVNSALSDPADFSGLDTHTEKPSLNKALTDNQPSESADPLSTAKALFGDLVREVDD